MFSLFFSTAAVSFALFSSAATYDHAAQSFVDELVPTLHSSGKFKESLGLPKNAFIFPNLWGFLKAFFNVVLHRMEKKNLERKLKSIRVNTLWR